MTDTHAVRRVLISLLTYLQQQGPSRFPAVRKSSSTWLDKRLAHRNQAAVVIFGNGVIIAVHERHRVMSPGFLGG